MSFREQLSGLVKAELANVLAVPGKNSADGVNEILWALSSSTAFVIGGLGAFCEPDGASFEATQEQYIDDLRRSIDLAVTQIRSSAKMAKIMNGLRTDV